MNGERAGINRQYANYTWGTGELESRGTGERKSESGTRADQQVVAPCAGTCRLTQWGRVLGWNSESRAARVRQDPVTSVSSPVERRSRSASLRGD